MRQHRTVRKCISRVSGIVVTVFVLVALSHAFENAEERRLQRVDRTVCSAAEDDCGPNEVRRTCGSSRIPTCQHPQTAATSCIALCKIACFCQYGSIRDERTRKCVKYSQCSQNVSFSARIKECILTISLAMIYGIGSFF